MKPEDIKKIVEIIHAENSDGLYVIIYILLLLAPVLVWAVRIIMKNSIKDLVDKGVTPQINLLERTFKRDQESNEQMFNIMEMHIDELRRVKIEQEEIKRKVDKNSQKIGVNAQELQQIKNAG